MVPYTVMVRFPAEVPLVPIPNPVRPVDDTVVVYGILPPVDGEIMLKGGDEVLLVAVVNVVPKVQRTNAVALLDLMRYAPGSGVKSPKLRSGPNAFCPGSAVSYPPSVLTINTQAGCTIAFTLIALLLMVVNAANDALDNMQTPIARNSFFIISSLSLELNG